METSYSPRTLSFNDTMSRIQKEFQCDRKEAYKLLQELIKRKHIKLPEEDKD